MLKEQDFGQHWDAIVLGVLIVGLGAAWALVKAGLKRVLVLELHVVAGGASNRGTGSVHVQRWTETGVRLIQRSQALTFEVARQVGAAFRFNPRITPRGARVMSKLRMLLLTASMVVVTGSAMAGGTATLRRRSLGRAPESRNGALTCLGDEHRPPVGPPQAPAYAARVSRTSNSCV